tara:strand:- start:75 stop:608 length:534 start_codon:yes stop_codon:yes gene_type:complete
MGIFGAAKRGLGMLGRGLSKKKPTATPKPKPQERFVDKDPYERAAIISRRESAKRGDVWSGNTIVGTPGPHRSAEAIKKYHGPRSYQLTDPVRKVRTRKFAGALVRGAKNIVKHTPWRKELAGLKKTHRTKQKILKGRAARKEAASKTALAPNYGPYGKQLASQAQHPKSWRRAGKQ